MDIGRQESQLPDTIVKEHLENALDEDDVSEKDYYVRSALQYIVSEEMN